MANQEASAMLEAGEIDSEAESMLEASSHRVNLAVGQARTARFAMVAAIAAAFAVAGIAATAGLRPSMVLAQGHGPMGTQGTEVVIFDEDKPNATEPSFWIYGEGQSTTRTTTWTSTTALDYPNSTKDWPSLFCWLIAQTVGGERVNKMQGWMEEKLVWQMYLSKIGIFACNDFAVFTDIKCIISEMGGWGWPYVAPNYTAKDGEVLSWALGSTQTGRNGDSSPSNTWIFVSAWKALGASGALEKHNFVVKQDPDAVFIPWRVRWHANQWPSKDGSVPFFVKNCPGFGSMQGPLEIFSIALVRAFLPSIDSCGGGTAGEDSKMERCASQFGQPFMDGSSLDDKYCNHCEPNCWDGYKIAFHPFKDEKLFAQCYESSMQIERRQR